MQTTRTHRLWHWLDAAMILGVLATVVLRETYLNKHYNAAIVQKALADQNITITVEGATKVAKAIRGPMCEWHYVFGFAIVGLLIVRGALFIWQSDRAVWRESLLGSRDLRRCVFDSQRRRQMDPHRYHMAWVYCLYLIFYAALTLAACTGVLLYLYFFYGGLGLTKPDAHVFVDIHQFVGWFVVFFVPVHIAGVVVSEIRNKQHDVSHMIDGGHSDDSGP